MSRKSLTVHPPVARSDGPAQYATSDEARLALMQLTKSDLKKLLIVAELHCRYFGIPPSHMEPGELLNEAFRRTLDLTKRWRNGVGIAYHLNRAMENIAGHEVPKLARRFEVVQSESPDGDYYGNEDPLDDLQKPRSADETVVAKVGARDELRLLQDIFRDDLAALRVLEKRAARQEGKEIQASLNLSKQEYETINKRILRKIKSYYEPKSQAVHPGRGA
jgi:hypothetical protein